MNVEIEKLITLKLAPSEYCILALIYERQYHLLKGLFDLGLINEEDFESLETKRYVKLLGAFSDVIDFEVIVLRESGKLLFKIDQNEKFLALFTRYPVKVNTSSGPRILRPANSDTKEGKICLEKWQKIVGNDPNLPDLMIKCLDKQLQMERNKLEYMQQFIVWINKRTYERYIPFLKEETNKTNEVEGI